MSSVASNVPQQSSLASRPAGGVWLFSREGLVMAALLAVAFVGLFFRWFYTQHLSSSGAMEDWGHAYVIPIISGFLIWKAKAQLARVRFETFWPGLAPMVLGIASYFFCVVGIKNHMLQGFSMVLTIFGMALLLLGPAAMRVLFLPIAFLGFGITVSEAIMLRLTFPLQMIATQGGYVVLNLVGALFGFSCDARGNVLEVMTSTGRKIPLNVAEACSGMRMVVAFVALGAATALIACKSWWQRILLVLLAPPVAIIVNVFRVAILGILSLRDPDLAAGEAHTLIGTILLIPGLGLFLLVVWSLNRIVAPEPTGVKS